MSFSRGREFSTLLAFILPFCLSPIFIVPILNVGASASPLELLPTTASINCNALRYLNCPNEVKAIDFEYEDRNGKKYALSDFKGKVVLVDVWASWCGPCLRQIPYMKKLEEEFKGKDVVFLGVSVDEVKNKDKWLESLDTKKPTGIQLWAKGWDSHIAKAYKIRSIPRFLLFDKEGNIISVDAPRPSDPKLKTLIEKYLKK